MAAIQSSSTTRLERDTMGELAVPATAYYGVQTARAIENFPISALRFPRAMIRALGRIKRAAATVNQSLGLLDKPTARPLSQAATDVVEGRLDAEFPVDIFQTGSGTSTNMNTNEVISNRATELLGGARGSKLVHPNDHVNLGQSSNDVIPTAIHIAAGELMQQQLIPALTGLHKSLARKAKEFDQIVKIGRTHLQDATPVRLGQEFGGYARQIELGHSAGEAGPSGPQRSGAGRHRRRHGAQLPSEVLRQGAGPHFQGDRLSLYSKRRTTLKRSPRRIRWSRRAARSRPWP